MSYKCVISVLLFKPMLCSSFREGEMAADHGMDLKEAFQRAQRGLTNKAQLVASLSRYDEVINVINMIHGTIQTSLLLD